MWNCPYSNDSFPTFAEDIGGGASPSADALSAAAKAGGVVLVGGSIPERSGSRLYNTCCVFDADGALLAKHRCRKSRGGVGRKGLKVTGLGSRSKVGGEREVVEAECAEMSRVVSQAVAAVRRPFLTLYSPSPPPQPCHPARKTHLFDIDIPGGQRFKESDTLTAGSALTVVDTRFGRLGVGICYDLRFPELAQLCRQRGAQLLVYPGAFNMTTGPAHWELLLRARALDNLLFVAACSPARDESAGYVAWGHSLAVGPWGNVLVDAGSQEGIAYAELDLGQIEAQRTAIPIMSQRRSDVYELVDKTLE